MHAPTMLSSELLLSWYYQNKRILPWRKTKNPYFIWISEIMLQQTRVETVHDYYLHFLACFPTIHDLANAPQQNVLKVWEGLGYYSRARNLQKTAQIICQQNNGVFPNTYAELLKLPGIGPYTAGAVASIAFDERVPAIDGNVYRVSSRFFGFRENIERPSSQRALRDMVANCLPTHSVGDFNQALMELGATICIPVRPKCELCPIQNQCDAWIEGDAPSLPIHEKKPPQKEMDVTLCLATYKDKIVICKRKEQLLKGLYVFLLLEGNLNKANAQNSLNKIGLQTLSPKQLGEARHVFTHRIWNMHLFHFQLMEVPPDNVLNDLCAKMVDRQELLSLPFPTAMRTAKQNALSLLP